MKAIEFPQQSFILAKDQPQYIPLPVHAKEEPIRFKDAEGNEVVKDTVMELTACFQLSPEEVAQVVATGKIWYTQCVWGAAFQPIRMSVLNPFTINQMDDQKGVSDVEIAQGVLNCINSLPFGQLTKERMARTVLDGIDKQ